MKNAVVINYGAVLFEAALEENVLDRTDTDLERFLKVFHFDGRFSRLLTSPVISFRVKKDVIETVQSKLRLCEVALHFLLVLAQNNRFPHVISIIKEYKELRDRHMGFLDVTVTTAHELDNKTSEKIREKLEKYTGKKVRLEHSADESLIGGVRITIGDKQIDNTVKGQLQRVKKELMPRAQF